MGSTLSLSLVSESTGPGGEEARRRQASQSFNLPLRVVDQKEHATKYCVSNSLLIAAVADVEVLARGDGGVHMCCC